MRNCLFQQLLCLFLLFMIACEGEAQNVTKKMLEKPDLMIDNFDQKNSSKRYLPYAGEVVVNQEGYGIYYPGKVDIQLFRVSLNEADKALRIRYGLEPFFWYGNWVSIRKEFKATLDLSEYKGVELEVKIESPSNALLRLTLSDVETLQDAGKHGTDEMWWVDFPDILGNTNTKWITIRAPFRDFYLSYGEGTRHNNGKKDLSRIISYEINLISEGDKHPKGVILVNSLRAYKD